MRHTRRTALLLWLLCVTLLAAGPARAGTEDALARLGATPCPESEFSCVTLTVPLDHLDPADGRTIDVVFAVLPATGKSKGLFVTATGGPGSAGIGLADYYTSYFDPSITRRFDIVFFDQRGIGLSGGLTCPIAVAAYYRSQAPPDDAASRFSADCVSELGSPSNLPYLGTKQAIEDLEVLRLALDSPHVWLYGESYGTLYFGVDCQDYAYYSGTPDERAARYLADAEGVAASYPRVGSAVFLSDLPCAYWPAARQDPGRPAPLRAEGVPTLVLSATGDPITPAGQGERVYRRLADSYLVTTQGGPHVTFGRGNDCPDELVRAFLVEGSRPRQRQVTCPGTLVTGYVPLAPENAASFEDAGAAFSSAERELAYLPEYYYWDFETPTSVGCPAGGGFVRFSARGSVARLTLERCGFTRGFVMTGTGRWDYDRDRVVLDVTVTSRLAGSYRYVRQGGAVSVEAR